VGERRAIAGLLLALGLIGLGIEPRSAALTLAGFAMIAAALACASARRAVQSGTPRARVPNGPYRSVSEPGTG
jgi:hypothetical protein